MDKSSFSKLIVSMNGRSQAVTLEFTLIYTRPDGSTIEVPVGFHSDFATIPRIFWVLLPPWGYGRSRGYGICALLHDYAYAYHRLLGLTRKECDKLFYEAMKQEGVQWFIRKTIYYAVRIFGASHFKG